MIGLLLLYAIWEGAREGLIRQVLGLAALILGIYFAWKMGGSVGAMFGLEGTPAVIAGFVTVLVVVIVAVALIARLTRGLFKLVGLGIFDNLLGIIFSVFKMLLVTGIILMVVEVFDTKGKLIDSRIKARSPMYRAATAVTGAVFPYLDWVKDSIWDTSGRKRRSSET